MQLLLDATKTGVSNDACALTLLDTVPLVMRIIRKHMRSHRSGLTVPQFRSLCYASTTTGSSLSAVADFIGLSLPAMSRLVDGLVAQKLMERRTCDDDRRHVRLSVTANGEIALREARQLAQAGLAAALSKLDTKKRASIVATMQILRNVFTPELISDDDDSKG